MAYAPIAPTTPGSRAHNNASDAPPVGMANDANPLIEPDMIANQVTL